MKRKTYYMHTLDGKPAMFDGQQICFANFFGNPTQLCENLAQIRREQSQSARWRKKNGYRNSYWKVGHIRVTPPTREDAP